MADTPVGLRCPGCGEPPLWLFGDTQAWCVTDDCPFLTWNPTKTLAELNADSKAVSLPPGYGGGESGTGQNSPNLT